MSRSNTNIVSFSVLSVCCHCIAFVLLPKHLLVAGGTTTATTTNGVSSVSVVPIDLSYLHGCGAYDLASVIRGRLEEEQFKKQQQQLLFLASTQDYTRNTKTETESETETVLLDIDLTASLIGKNVSEILSSLKEQQQQQRSSKEDPSDGATTSARSIPIKLTARRNRLSPREATAVLEFVLENGPTNETRTTAATARATTTATINENEKVASTASSGEEETAPSEETIATEVSEESQAENNATAVDASSTITDTNNTTNASTTTPSTESDSQNGKTKDDVDGIGSEKEATTEETPIATATTTTKTTTFTRPAFVSIQSLDLGWNNLGISASATGPSSARSNVQIRALNTALRRLLADREQCPPCIKLNVCGLGPQACRDLAKGIVDRYNHNNNSNKNQLPIPPLFLDLACNEGIGDVGVAALAAAIRTVAPSPRDGFDDKRKTKKRKKRRKSRSNQQSTTLLSEKEENETKSNENSNEENSTTASVESGPPEESSRTVLERLDLSGCGIGDAGAEALAIALANNPLCIKHLDLSNNRISDQGAAALAKALLGGLIETLDLSHNKDLGDAGAKQLAIAFQEDRISKLVLRSCNIRADGAACFGRALRVLGAQVPVSGEQALSSQPQPRGIDLSGNPLGILGKKKKASNKYSATALRSKATDTTKAYMNIIGKSLQKGLNSINAATNGDGMDTLESDDEEEGRMGELDEEDESRKKCGALSLAEAFIEDGFEDGTTKSGDSTDKEREGSSLRVELGLRHCSFDTRAAEALAAVLHESKENFPRMKLSLDTRMNHVLEDDVVAALHNGNDDGDDQLVADMAEVYLDALEVMKEASERALQASRMAASRAKAAAVREAAWGAPPPGRRQYHDYEEEWSDEEKEDDEEWDDPTIIADDDYDRNFEEDYSDEDW